MRVIIDGIIIINGRTNLEQDEDEEQLVDDGDTEPESPVSCRERK